LQVKQLAGVAVDVFLQGFHAEFRARSTTLQLTELLSIGRDPLVHLKHRLLNSLHIARTGVHFRLLPFVAGGAHRAAITVSSRIQPPQLCENAHHVPASQNAQSGRHRRAIPQPTRPTWAAQPPTIRQKLTGFPPPPAPEAVRVANGSRRRALDPAAILALAQPKRPIVGRSFDHFHKYLVLLRYSRLHAC
jgi:hypothetical protein